MFNGEKLSAFEHLMDSVLQRMSVPNLNTRAKKTYQIEFSDTPTLWITKRLNDWFEISIQLEHLLPQDGTQALALLGLQHQQDEGPLIGIGLNPKNNTVFVQTRLHSLSCAPSDVIEAIQLIRARAAAVHALLHSKSSEAHQNLKASSI